MGPAQSRGLRARPLTIDDVLAARMVSDPLTVRDCCLVTDGGGAYRDGARRPRRGPAEEAGLRARQRARRDGTARFRRMPDLTVTRRARVRPRAFAMAGMAPKDIDVVQLYDAFTINTLLFLEDLGFCAKGEGGAFVANGGIAPGGQLPVNTNGGGLSCVHPGMYGIFLLIEAVRQLRGEAGERQVAARRSRWPWQRRHAVQPGHGDSRHGGRAVTLACQTPSRITSAGNRRSAPSTSRRPCLRASGRLWQDRRPRPGKYLSSPGIYFGFTSIRAINLPSVS